MKKSDLLYNLAAIPIYAILIGNFVAFFTALATGPGWMVLACAIPICWPVTGIYGIYLILTWIGIA